MTALSNQTSQRKDSLVPHLQHLGTTTEEQIAKNQAAIELIRSWRKENMSEQELMQAGETWEKVKTIIDEYRDIPLFSDR